MKKLLDTTGRVSLLRSLNGTEGFSLNSMAKILDVNPSNIYFEKESDLYVPLNIKNAIDRIHTEYPTWGHRKITKQLQQDGYNVSEYKTKVFMSEMGLHMTFQDNAAKKSLLREASSYYSVPSSLKALYPDHVWCIAVTYIRLKYDFAFMFMVMDCYSTYIIDWCLSDKLDVNIIVSVLEKLFKISLPEILNSDPSTPFNGAEYLKLEENYDVIISMNHRYNWCDSKIEQWFGNLKILDIYPNEYANFEEAKKGIEEYIHTYNSPPDLHDESLSPYALYKKSSL